MTNYYAEVIIPESGNGKSKLVGLHEVSGKQKPDPACGGNECLPITEVAYNLLRATEGSINRIEEVVLNLREWLDGDES